MEAAIYGDCHNLIERFVSTGSFDFPSFCIEWKKIHFQHIFSCQTSIVEVLLTTSAIFHIAKRTICAKDEVGKHQTTAAGKEEPNLLRRIGGLYLLYGTYFKQPTRQFLKVQVSMETWDDMTSFIESLELDPRMDCARYTFWRLYQADAFRFTALDYMVGLERLVDYDKIGDESKISLVSQTIREKLKHKLTSLTDINESIQDMTKLEDEYNSIKKEISGPAKANENQLTLPTTSIFHKLQDVLNNINSIMNDVPVQTQKKRNDTISKTRIDIKRKAAGLTGIHEEQSSKDSTDLDSNCRAGQQEPKKISTRKPLSEVRYSTPAGLFSLGLPDHISNDLVAGSSSTCDEDGAEEQEGNESFDNTQKQTSKKTYTNL